MKHLNYEYSNETMEKMLELVSSKTGLIKRVTSQKQTCDKNHRLLGNILPLYFSTAEIKLTNYEWYKGGCGASLSKSRSIIKAIGESIERYCAISFEEQEVYMSVDELIKIKERYIDPISLINFDDNQYLDPNFPYEKYSSDMNLYWIKANNLTNNCNVLVPAQKVLLSYKDLKPECYLDCRLSTGLACGDSLYGATLSGIYECIERDSFYLTWLYQIPGKIINVNKIKDKNLANLYEAIKMNSLDDLYIVKLDSDMNVYSILTMFVNNKDGAVGLSVACASDLNPEKALFKSLEELILTNSFMYTILEDEYDGKYPDFQESDILRLDDHLKYYLNPSSNKVLNFMIDNKECINLSDLQNNSSGNMFSDMNFCINELKKVNIDTLVVDITKEEIDNIGLKVVKVLTPGLANLDVSFRARNLGGARIKNYLETSKFNINENPHPFP